MPGKTAGLPKILLEQAVQGIGNFDDWTDQIECELSALELPAAAYATNIVRGDGSRFVLPAVDKEQILRDNPPPVRALGQPTADYEAELAEFASLKVKLLSQAAMERSKLQHKIDLEGTTVFNHIWASLSWFSNHRTSRHTICNSEYPSQARSGSLQNHS